MKPILLQLLAVLLVSGASALELNDMADPRVASLMNKNCIRSKIGGVMPAQFNRVTLYLNRPDMLPEIQDAYLRLLSGDGTIDNTIVQTGPGTYYYINERKQRTDIIELYRKQTAGRAYDLVYYASGRRFFGRYEMVVHIRALNAGPAGTLYTASLHVYPYNGPVRFFVRRFGTVERYFRQRTRMMAQVSAGICRELNDPLELIYPSPALLSGRPPGAIPNPTSNQVGL